MKYYILECDSPFYGGYPKINSNFLNTKFELHCQNSNLDQIDPNTTMAIWILKHENDEYTDFMYDYGNRIPLISDRFKKILDNFGVNNVLYKKIILQNFPIELNQGGESHECWLALPSRIDCIDFEKSERDLEAVFITYTKLVISEAKAKNYDIFKISREDDKGAIGPEIIVSERLKDYIEKWQKEHNTKLTCVYFRELDE